MFKLIPIVFAKLLIYFIQFKLYDKHKVHRLSSSWKICFKWLQRVDWPHKKSLQRKKSTCRLVGATPLTKTLKSRGIVRKCFSYNLSKPLPSYAISIKPKGLLKCESRFHSLMLMLSLCRNMRMLGRKAFWKSSSLELRRDWAHFWRGDSSRIFIYQWENAKKIFFIYFFFVILGSIHINSV